MNIISLLSTLVREESSFKQKVVMKAIVSGCFISCGVTLLAHLLFQHHIIFLHFMAGSIYIICCWFYFCFKHSQVREALKENLNHNKVDNSAPSGEKRKENQLAKPHKKGDTCSSEDVHCLKKQKVTCEKDHFKDKPRQNEGYSVALLSFILFVFYS